MAGYIGLRLLLKFMMRRPHSNGMTDRSNLDEFKSEVPLALFSCVASAKAVLLCTAFRGAAVTRVFDSHVT